jgi:hypothetical protein
MAGKSVLVAHEPGTAHCAQAGGRDEATKPGSDAVIRSGCASGDAGLAVQRQPGTVAEFGRSANRVAAMSPQ